MGVSDIKDSWDMEIIELIKRNLSDEKIAKQVPFRSDYVKRLRRKLKGGDNVKWHVLSGEMSQATDNYMMLFGNITGEMQMDVESVPVAPNVDVEALKSGDDSPLEVVVEVPASKSTRGWNYKGQSLKDIVNAVNTKTLNGFLGHQKPEDVGNQFLPPVTHWIGAKMVGEIAYFRGVIDKSADDLKRWIKSGRIKQVSIFGRPKLENAAGETNVVGYDPMSIDWTPLDRAGMQTSIVAMSGEMWDIDGNGPNKNENQDGGAGMNPEELLKMMKQMADRRQINMTMIAGEMGMTTEQIVGELDNEFLQNAKSAVDTLNRVNSALGVTGEMDTVTIAVEAAQAIEKTRKAEFQTVLGEMMEQKVESKAVRKDINDESTVIGRLWSHHTDNIDPKSSKDDIAGEMDKFLNDDVVKNVISGYHTDKSANLGGTGGGGNKPKIKKVSL